MFHGGPFTVTNHREPGTVDDKMDGSARGDATQRQVEPPRQCGVSGRGQVEAQHPEDRPQKALRLAEGQVKEQAERQRGFDGDVRVLQLPAPLADTRGLPPGDRLRLDLIDTVEGEVSCLTADAAYDTRGIYEAAGARGATVVIPPTRTATVSGRQPRSPARDRTIRQVQQVGRRQRKKDSGYHQRARVENAFFRYKSIIGESLRARSRPTR